jgi:hypothetical protein
MFSYGFQTAPNMVAEIAFLFTRITPLLILVSSDSGILLDWCRRRIASFFEKYIDLLLAHEPRASV